MKQKNPYSTANDSLVNEHKDIPGNPLNLNPFFLGAIRLNQKVTFKTFFKNASINPNAHLIKGVICGYRIENITTPLTKKRVT